MKIEKEAEELSLKADRWLYLAVVVSVATVTSTALDWFLQGIPTDFVVPLLDRPASVSTLTYLATIYGCGGYVGCIGLRKLLYERQFSVEFLMAAASVGAGLIGHLFEASVIVFFYSLAEYFEGRIEDRARGTIESLSSHIPDMARRVEEAQERQVRIIDVLPGEVILVKPGERIPLDGKVLEGVSYIDQSIVTGESKPLLKKKGDDVFAGSLNNTGPLKVRVIKVSEETLVARIVRLVIRSRGRKANLERLTERVAKVYVPAAILTAVAVAVLFPIFLGGEMKTWMYRALILLVVACPSAFILSVPATIFTATTVAAKRGAIVKGGVYIENLHKVTSVVFDKTGTLTLGRLKVTDIEMSDKESLLLSYAAALERYSTHPVAEAIVKGASEKGLNLSAPRVDGVTEIPGKGIVGIVNGLEVTVGNVELIRERVAKPGSGFEVSRECDLHSRVCVSVDRKFVGTICVEDKARDDAAEAVRQLREIGVYTVMLTGDTEHVAMKMAQELQLDEYRAEVLPEDKQRIVDRLRTDGGLVAMVGDGVNDAPALAASDVGIAMGGSGVDIALESADVVLVKDELVRIPYLVRLSRLTMKVARENVVISLVTKLALGALGLLGLTPLWFTVAAGDDGITLLTLLNLLRIIRLRD
ncbi:cadmium-translocating P-type ATPase [Candidatus Bathyarchaeota archaeon]|nr:cadmium-translocating P-type ATPase [Candidatus Bathyarchaeota archaeon]